MDNSANAGARRRTTTVLDAAADPHVRQLIIGSRGRPCLDPEVPAPNGGVGYVGGTSLPIGRVRWRADLGKCVDATPLVVLVSQRRQWSQQQALLLHSRSHRLQQQQQQPGGEVKGEAREQGDCIGPTMEEGYVVVGSHAHLVQALSLASGACLWRTHLPDRVDSSAALSRCGRYVVVGCYDGGMYTLCSRTGDVWWRFDTGGQVKSSPAVHQDTGVTYCASHSGLVAALDVARRAVLWTGHAGATSDAAAATGPLPVNVRDTPVTAHEATGDGGRGRFAGVFASPVIDCRRAQLYIASLSGQLLAYSINADDVHDLGIADIVTAAQGRAVHATAWITPAPAAKRAPDAVTIASPAGGEGGSTAALTTLTSQARVAAVAGAGAGEEGRHPLYHRPIWCCQMPAPVFSTPALHAVAGVLVVCCVDGSLHGITTHGGTRLWTSLAPGPIFSSPALLINHNNQPNQGQHQQPQQPQQPQQHQQQPQHLHQHDHRCPSASHHEDTDISGDAFVVGCHGNAVLAYNFAGEPLWTSPADGTVYASPCPTKSGYVGLTGLSSQAGGGGLVTATTTGTVSLLDAASGERQASVQLPGEIFSSPVVYKCRAVNGCANVNCGDSSFRGEECGGIGNGGGSGVKATGPGGGGEEERKCEVEEGEREEKTWVAAEGHDGVLVGCRDNYLYCLTWAPQ